MRDQFEELIRTHEQLIFFVTDRQRTISAIRTAIGVAEKLTYGDMPADQLSLDMASVIEFCERVDILLTSGELLGEGWEVHRRRFPGSIKWSNQY